MRFLGEAKAQGNADDATLKSVSLIDEDHGKRVRMGHLAFVGSHHDQRRVGAAYRPDEGDGVRRSQPRSCPAASSTRRTASRRAAGSSTPIPADQPAARNGRRGVVDNIERIRDFERYVDDSSARDRFAAIKRRQQERSPNMSSSRRGVRIDPAAVFDIHVKRIHEYKRQLLNILRRSRSTMRSAPIRERDWRPRVKLFAGKAAASYCRRSIIRLVNDVARKVNNDPAVRNLLKVVFMPEFQRLARRTDRTGRRVRQISARHGGVGDGQHEIRAERRDHHQRTLDGANVEIREHVGENIVIFGPRPRGGGTSAGGHRPRHIIANDAGAAPLDPGGAGDLSPGSRPLRGPLRIMEQRLFPRDRRLRLLLGRSAAWMGVARSPHWRHVDAEHGSAHGLVLLGFDPHMLEEIWKVPHSAARMDERAAEKLLRAGLASGSNSWAARGVTLAPRRGDLVCLSTRAIVNGTACGSNARTTCSAASS